MSGVVLKVFLSGKCLAWNVLYVIISYPKNNEGVSFCFGTP